MNIYDLARIIRSKNAGPFTFTVDIFPENNADFERILATLDPESVATLYEVPADRVRIVPLRNAGAIKVTIPRRYSAGSPFDGDVYGCQQHMPIGSMTVSEPTG